MWGRTDVGMNFKVLEFENCVGLQIPACFRFSLKNLNPDSDSSGCFGAGSAHFQPQRTLGAIFEPRPDF